MKMGEAGEYYVKWNKAYPGREIEWCFSYTKLVLVLKLCVRVCVQAKKVETRQ